MDSFARLAPLHGWLLTHCFSYTRVPLADGGGEATMVASTPTYVA